VLVAEEEDDDVVDVLAVEDELLVDWADDEAED